MHQGWTVFHLPSTPGHCRDGRRCVVASPRRARRKLRPAPSNASGRAWMRAGCLVFPEMLVWFDCSGGGGGTGLSPFLDGAAAGRSSVQRGVRGNGVESGRRKGGRYFVYRPPPVVISSADGRGRRCLAGAPPCHCRSARAPLPFVQPEVQSCRLRARRRHEEPTPPAFVIRAAAPGSRSGL